MIDYLEWDSSFWGLRIAKVKVSSAGEFCKLFDKRDSLQSEYDLIYIFATCDLNVQNPNIFFVDRKVEYTAPIVETDIYDAHIIEYDKPFVSDELLELALGSGVYSRFKKDTNFPDNSYERLYTQWIEQSVNHKIATEVFCYMNNGVPCGLLTLNRKEKTGNFGLLAITPSYQGHGIGYAMLSHAKHFMYLKDYNSVSLVTQSDNKIACHLYEKAGFRVKSTTDVYHWWINKKD